MGKKKRREREVKREDFAAKRSREKRKSNLMIAGVIGIVAVIVGISAYNFVTMGANVPGSPPGSGLLGDEHEHAAILVKIFEDKFDFSSPAFQIKNTWIHFEGRNGDIIHRHSSGVTMGYLFGTLGLGLTDECYIFGDGREFCTNNDYSLKFFINHEQVQSILSIVPKEGDRILISYGSQTSEDIQKQLLELDGINIGT